jgi:hypothetical protein
LSETQKEKFGKDELENIENFSWHILIRNMGISEEGKKG